MTFVSIVLRASAVLAVGWVAHAAFARKMSAATRHFVLTLVVYAVLLLPLFSAVVPAWPLLVIAADRTPPPAALVDTASATAVAAAPLAADPGPQPAPWPISWTAVAAALYATGVMLVVLRMIVERLSLRKLVVRASLVRDSGWTTIIDDCAHRMQVRRPIRLLRNASECMPMAFGLTRAAILIPRSADGWQQGRRRAVLMHEVAHIARNDCFTQMLAAFACAIYWIHPMVWWVAKRLRIERELACDDRVLTLGAEPREYAEDLLELAYTLGKRRAPALAVTMASSHHIEDRMLAVLDDSRSRATPPWTVRAVAVVLAVALTVPIAAATTSEHPVATPLVTAAAQPLAFGQRPPLTPPHDTGTWEIRASADARTVHLRMTESDGSYGTTIDVDRLSGLPATLLTGAAGPAKFSLRRDAGTFNFEGVFRNGVGGGTYAFAPNPDFADAFAKRGYARPTPAEQYLFARANFDLSFLDELSSQNYARPDTAQLIRAVQHGVSLAFLRDMGQLGYRLEVIDALITLRNHGVSPQYVRDFAAEGLKGLSADELVRARSHGVSPEYVRELRAFGHQGLTLDTLIRLRDHGVSPQYLRELVALGYDNMPVEVTIRLRNHGVSPEYVRDLRAQGYANLPVEALIRLRTHGVSPEYVRALNDLGYTRLTIDDLVGLRNHGVSAERIRQANARAGERLTIDALKSAAANGWR